MAKSISSLEEQKRYWRSYAHRHQVTQGDYMDLRDDKYKPLKKAMQDAINSANDLKDTTKEAIETMGAGAVVAENKGYGEDDLTKHSENMAAVAVALQSIVDYCNGKISDLNAKVNHEQSEINYATNQIYYIDNEIARLKAEDKTTNNVNAMTK